MARRLFASATVAAATAAGAVGVVAVTASPAAATAGCVVADSYAVHTVTPANAAGGSVVAGARFGAATVTGDFNRDGFADVAVGAPGDTVGGVAAGTVSVFNGSAAGVATTGVRLTQTNLSAGNEAGDRFGAVLAAGDFNKDGFADLAVGIPGEAVGSNAGAGAIGVFAGKTSGLTTGTWYSQTLGGGGDEAGDGFGSALATGDLNGDGFVDLAIGTPGEAPNGGTVHGGTVYVYKGSSTGVVKGWTAGQEDAAGTTEAGDRFGAALAIGNVTGSANVDMVVGAPGEAPGSDPANSGAVYVVPGASTGKSAGFGRFQSGNGGANEAGDNLGAALAVGDFDKDGFSDIAAGVPGEAPGTAAAGGSILVFPGASSQVAAGYWLNENAGGEVIGAGDRFGSALAAADVDGDGFADLLAGAPGKTYGTATAAGTTYLFVGRPRDTGSTASLKLGRRIGQGDVKAANQSNDAFGSGVALGDVTGDGKRDAVIGASGEAPTGLPASGVAVQLSNLAIPASAPVPLEWFSRMSAMQGTPAGTALLGTLEYAYADNIGRLVHGHQSDPDNFSSVQWTVISGLEAFTGQPALAEQADGRLTVAGHNANGPVWVNTQATKNPPAWGSWVTPPGPMLSHATITMQPDGALVAFAVDAGGVLWALPQGSPNGAYTSWVSLGVTDLVGTPTAVTTSSGIQVFALDHSGDIKTALYSGDRTLSGCTSLGGSGLTGSPSVVVYPGSKLRVFVRAGDGSILTQAQDTAGVFPGTWDTVGTFTAVGPPSALLNPVSGKTEVVALGPNGAIYNTGETVQGSGVWRNWAQATVDGDVSATDPTALSFTNSNGQAWGFVFRTVDNVARIYQASDFVTALVDTTDGAPTFEAVTLPALPR